MLILWIQELYAPKNPICGFPMLCITRFQETCNAMLAHYNGGGQGDWNREHTYPKSLGNPNLGSSGPGSDSHHLRPSDVGYNSQRGNLKFTDGSGNSGNVSGGWYPGDEWKGDIARMMMYMYLRYSFGDMNCIYAYIYI